MTAPTDLRIAGDLTPELLDAIRAGLGEPGTWDATVVAALVGEIDRLRQRVNPATWTAPDGTVLDLTRQVFDRDGEAWTLDEVAPLTMTMVDGDLADRPLPYLFERRGPLTNEGVEV